MTVCTVPADGACWSPSTLDEALAALGAASRRARARRRHRPDGRDQQGPPPLAGDETVVARRTGSPSCGRGSHDPAAGDACASAPASPTPSSLAPPLADAAAGARPRRRAPSARRRSATRRRSAATSATCSPAGDGLPVLAALDATVELRRPDGDARRAGRRVHDRRQAHRPAARRADHGGHRAGARRLAGLRQGRRAQRDGDRHRRRLPRRRRARRAPCASPSARWPRRSCGPPRPRRSPPAPSTGTPARVDRRRRRPRSAALAAAGGPPDRRPPGHRRLPPARGRGARRPPAATGVPAGADHERAVHASHVNGTAHRRAPTRGSARACCTCCASGSACSAPRARASRASAARAACSSTASWCAACLVLAASAVDQPIDDDRGHRRAGRADRRAAGVRRRRRRAVRLLHAGAGRGRPRAARPQRRADADRDPRGAVGQHLPLHRVRPDRRGRAAGRRASGAGR